MANVRQRAALDDDPKELPTPTAIISEDSEEWEATNELLDDPEFAADFEAAKKDVAEGRTFRWEDIKREV